MVKKALLISIVMLGLVLTGVTNKCLADASSQLKQAGTYKIHGYFNQAEVIYKAVVADYPGTDYALEAQKELVLVYLLVEKKVQTDADVQGAYNKLVTDFSGSAGLPGAIYDVAVEYERLRRYEEAKNLYQQITQQHPSTSSASKAQLDIPKADILALIESGNHIDAETATNQLLIDFSGNAHMAKAIWDIALYSRRFNNPQRATVLYQSVVDNWPQSKWAAWAQMGLTKSYIDAGDDSSAQGALNKLVSDFSGNSDLPELLYYVARRYRKLKKYQEAKSVYQQIIQLDPNSPFASEAQVRIPKIDIFSYLESENYTAAQTAVNSLIADFSGNLSLPLALYEIAGVYERSKKYQEATSLYQQLIGGYSNIFCADKAQLDIPKIQVFTLIDTGDDTTAYTATDGLITDFQGSSYLPDVVLQIGRQYYGKALQLVSQDAVSQAQDKFQKTAAIYELVITKLPASESTPKAYRFAGDCCHRLREYTKSIERYQKIVDDYPMSNLAWNAQYLVGYNYEQMSKAGLISESETEPKIRSAYEQLLERYPDCPAAEAAQNWLTQHTEP